MSPAFSLPVGPCRDTAPRESGLFGKSTQPCQGQTGVSDLGLTRVKDGRHTFRAGRPSAATSCVLMGGWSVDLNGHASQATSQP